MKHAPPNSSEPHVSFQFDDGGGDFDLFKASPPHSPSYAEESTRVSDPPEDAFFHPSPSQHVRKQQSLDEIDLLSDGDPAQLSPTRSVSSNSRKHNHDPLPSPTREHPMDINSNNHTNNVTNSCGGSIAIISW